LSLAGRAARGGEAAATRYLAYLCSQPR
jgi:hypothetical protein